MNPETFEYEQERQICCSTPDNLKTLERRRGEQLNALWGRYLHGGGSPRKTYLHFAQNYADVDIGYGSYVND
jgi:hypothetical protein